jgi:hypothetical protein
MDVETSVKTIVESIIKKSILPSEEDKIRESVQVGSVFLALDDKFFTAEALLQWLTTVPITERTQIAYKAVCTKIPPNSQYLADSYHFLTKKPEYLSIAIKYNFSTEIPDQNIEGDMNPIIGHLCEALIDLNSNNNLRRVTALICSGAGPLDYILLKIETCFGARNFPHLRNVSAFRHNTGLVAADWTAKFRYNERLPIIILNRITQLQKEAPVYYAGVAYAAYYKVAVKLNKDRLLTHLNRHELTLFDSFFPNIIDKQILKYTDLAYKIALLGNDVAGYILGFPVQNMIPDEQQIHRALLSLTNLGVDRYTELIRNYVAATYTPILPFEQDEAATYSNDTDVVMEPINNYVPFDIVVYQTGSHMYRFTRIEFDKLAESKKNPWTNDWFPPTVLSTINARVKAAKELGLPTARPLTETLAHIEAGTLFKDETAPKSPPIQPVNPQQSQQSANILELLLNRALQGEWNSGAEMQSSNTNVHITINDTPVSMSTFTGFQDADQPSADTLLGQFDDFMDTARRRFSGSSEPFDYVLGPNIPGSTTSDLNISQVFSSDPNVSSPNTYPSSDPNIPLEPPITSTGSYYDDMAESGLITNYGDSPESYSYYDDMFPDNNPDEYCEDDSTEDNTTEDTSTDEGEGQPEGSAGNNMSSAD